MNYLLILIAIFLKTKKILLEISVDSVKPLRADKDQSGQLFARTGKLIDCDQHATLLISAATSHGSQSVSTSSISTRKIYNTELGGSDFEIDSPSKVADDLDYDTDSSATTLLESMTNRGNF